MLHPSLSHPLLFPKLIRSQQGGGGKTAGSCRAEAAWENPRSYREMTRPLGGIQGADHLQLDSSGPEWQAGREHQASTSSPAGIRNPCQAAFPLEVEEVAPSPPPAKRTARSLSRRGP